MPGPENEGGSVMLAARCQRSPWLAQVAVGLLCAVSMLKTRVAQGTSFVTNGKNYKHHFKKEIILEDL